MTTRHLSQAMTEKLGTFKPSSAETWHMCGVVVLMKKSHVIWAIFMISGDFELQAKIIAKGYVQLV